MWLVCWCAAAEGLHQPVDGGAGLQGRSGWHATDWSVMCVCVDGGGGSTLCVYVLGGGLLVHTLCVLVHSACVCVHARMHMYVCVSTHCVRVLVWKAISASKQPPPLNAHMHTRVHARAHTHTRTHTHTHTHTHSSWRSSSSSRLSCESYALRQPSPPPPPSPNLQAPFPCCYSGVTCWNSSLFTCRPVKWRHRLAGALCGPDEWCADRRSGCRLLWHRWGH